LLNGAFLKHLKSKTDPKSLETISMNGGVKETTRRSRQSFALGLGLVTMTTGVLLVHYHPELYQTTWIRNLIGGIILTVLIWTTWRLYQSRPNREDPYTIGDWAARSIDKPKKTH
jgi:hypothetical protein